MSDEALTELAEVVTVLGTLPVANLSGPLTDEERSAINVASRVVGAADLISAATGDETAAAVVAVLKGLPAVATMIAGLFASMRKIVVRVESLELVIEDLGADVEIGRLD